MSNVISTGPHDDEDPFTIEYERDGAIIAINAWVSQVSGVTVVQIDTNGDSGRIQISLNDSTVWDGDPDL